MQRSVATSTLALSALCVCATASSVDAQREERAAEGEVFEARARTEPPIAARAPLDPTAAGTRVEVETHRAGETLRDTLGPVPGVRMLGLGAGGHFLGASLRGGELSHTTVMLGDLALTGPDLGAVDLGVLDLSAIGALEVYRGGVPAMLGEAPIGGVLRIVPPRVEGTRAGGSLSYGSFDSGIARAWASARSGDVASYAALAADVTDGDYAYADDGGTRFDASDDHEVLRRNADSRGATGLVRVESPLPVGTLEGVVLWTTREAGVPGAGSQLGTRSRRAIDRYVGALAYRVGGDVDGHALSLDLQAAGWVGRSRFRDPWAEIGPVPRDTDDRQLRGLGRVVLGWAPIRELTLRALASARHDRFEPTDRASSIALAPSSRDAVVSALEGAFDPRIDDVRLALRASVRAEWSRAELSAPDVIGVTSRTSEVVLPTFRFGAALAPIEGLSLSASIAHGGRLPSMLELFGDRATLVPNARLEPERATLIDAGVTFRRALVPELTIDVEARGFVTFAEDLIRYRRNAQYAAIAETVASARIAGMELGLDARVLEHLRVDGSLTFLDARDSLERRLPLRAAWQAYARVEGSTARWLDDVAVSAWASASYTSANAVDPANLVVVGERTWLDAGARVAIFGVLGASLSVRDLLDARGQDFLGFPLPGRRFVAQADVQGEW